MKRNYSVVAALALSLLVAPACNKDKKADGDKAATSDKKVSASGAKGAANSGGEKGAALGDVIPYFPADTEIVVGFNIGDLTSGSLWKQYGALAMAGAPEEYKQFEAICGFDLITSLKTVHLGFNSAHKDDVTVIVSGLGREQVTNCAKAFAKKEGVKLDVTEEGKMSFFAGDGEKLGVAWINDSTALVVPEKADKAFLQARLDGKESLKSNAAFGAVLAKAKRTEPIWFAGSFADGSPAAKSFGSVGAAPKGVYGSVGLTGGLDIAMGLIFPDAKAATNTLNMAKPMMGMAKGSMGPAGALIDKVLLAVEGSDLTVKLKLSEADLKQLKDLAGPMFGGMMCAH